MSKGTTEEQLRERAGSDNASFDTLLHAANSTDRWLMADVSQLDLYRLDEKGNRELRASITINENEDFDVYLHSGSWDFRKREDGRQEENDNE